MAAWIENKGLTCLSVQEMVDNLIPAEAIQVPTEEGLKKVTSYTQSSNKQSVRFFTTEDSIRFEMEDLIFTHLTPKQITCNFILDKLNQIQEAILTMSTSGLSLDTELENIVGKACNKTQDVLKEKENKDVNV